MERVPENSIAKSQKTGRPSKWDKYADGQTYLAKQGLDFAGDIDSFRQSLYSAAYRLRKRVITDISREHQTVTFRFYDPEQEHPE